MGLNTFIVSRYYDMKIIIIVTYALLRALGAHEQMDIDSLYILIQWNNTVHLVSGGLTPHTDKLENATSEKPLLECVRERLGPKYKTDITCANAARFRGDKRRPSYKSLYSEVWEEQKYENLCKALSSPPTKRPN